NAAAQIQANCTSADYSRRPVLLLEQNNRKAWHLPEVAHVGSQHGEAQRECCRSNQQVWVRNDDTADSLLSIQSPCEQSHLFRVGVHRQIGEEFIEKRLATQAQRRSVGSVKPMDQFRQSDRRERRLLISRGVHDALNQPHNGFAAPFCANYNARIDDQSHAGGSRGSRWLSMASSTSFAKPLSSVAVEPRSRASRSDSDSKR